MHVCPVAVQSLQVPPRLPQVVLLGFWQLPPWQHPVRQLRKLQLPPPEEPLDDPEELPLDELLVGAAHDPLWHVWLNDVQSLHVPPWVPQDESSRPELQLPFESQHPLVQVAAQPVLLLPSSPVGLLEGAASSLDALLSSPEGVFRPGPVLVGIGAASRMMPASCGLVGWLWL